MKLAFKIAGTDDVDDLVRLRNEVSQHLASLYGQGIWAGKATTKATLFHMRTSNVFVARYRKRLIATFTLSTKKPWAIDRKYFTPCKRPLYLTAMAVHPVMQRKGIGRLCIEEALRFTRGWPADAIFLDAFDADAGAGEFYSRCGFREVGRATYRTAPLIYYEMLV